MLETKELLYFVLSLAAIWVTFFLCWALYEIATLSRRANRIVDDVTQRVTSLEDMIAGWKDKLANPLTYMGLLAGGGKSLYSAFKGKKQSKKKALVDEE